MRGNHKPALMEWHEGDDLAIGQHRHLLIAGHDPLVRLHPHSEEPAFDKGLHASMEDVEVMP
jgi:hypothetical protein